IEIRALAHVFWFETWNAPWPLVSTWTVTVETGTSAWTFTVPTPDVALLMITVHVLPASTAPTVQVPPVIEPVPLIETAVTVAPFAAKNVPLPRSFVSVTVNVCGEPAWLLPDCWIEIRASTHVF